MHAVIKQGSVIGKRSRGRFKFARTILEGGAFCLVAVRISNTSHINKPLSSLDKFYT